MSPHTAIVRPLDKHEALTLSHPRSMAVLIPAYNEGERIGATLSALAEYIQVQAPFPLQVLEVLVVDDGSTDATASIAKEFTDELPEFSVLSLGKNRGKGYAIRRGLAQVQSTWVLIADADILISWRDAVKLSDACYRKGATIAVGSRYLGEAAEYCEESTFRRSVGLVFNRIVRFLVGLNFKDTQCGFKLCHREMVQEFLLDLRIDGFAWDVEFLALATRRDLIIKEIPIKWKHEHYGSKVHIFKDSFLMLKDILLFCLRQPFYKKRKKHNGNKNT